MGDPNDCIHRSAQFLYAWEIRLIRDLSRYFYKKFEILRRDGFDDLFQEGLIHWLSKRDLFNTADEEGCNPVMRRVIENKIMDIVDFKHRRKRKTIYETISLDDPDYERDEEESVKHFLADEEGFKDAFKCDIQDILRQARGKLSRRQRELCRLFEVEGMNWKEISKKMDIPRATLYEEVLRIREIFREEGLRDYL